MRETILIGLLVLAWSPSALAGDCPYWNRLTPAARSSDIEGMINAHMTSNNSKKYTSVDKVAIRRCLRDFVPADRRGDRPGLHGSTRRERGVRRRHLRPFLLSCV